MSKHYVEIVKCDSGEVVKRLGPMTRDEAVRTCGWEWLNLGYGFYVRFAEEEDELLR